MWGERGLRRAKGPSLPESPGGVHRPPGFPSHEGPQAGALRSARRKHTCPSALEFTRLAVSPTESRVTGLWAELFPHCLGLRPPLLALGSFPVSGHVAGAAEHLPNTCRGPRCGNVCGPADAAPAERQLRPDGAEAPSALWSEPPGWALRSLGPRPGPGGLVR